MYQSATLSLSVPFFEFDLTFYFNAKALTYLTAFCFLNILQKLLWRLTFSPFWLLWHLTFWYLFILTCGHFDIWAQLLNLVHNFSTRFTTAAEHSTDHRLKVKLNLYSQPAPQLINRAERCSTLLLRTRGEAVSHTALRLVDKWRSRLRSCEPS